MTPPLTERINTFMAKPNDDLDVTYEAHSYLMRLSKIFERDLELRKLLVGLKEAVYVTERDTDPVVEKTNRLSTEELHYIRDQLNVKGDLTQKGYAFTLTDGTLVELHDYDSYSELIVTGPAVKLAANLPSFAALDTDYPKNAPAVRMRMPMVTVARKFK